MFNFKFTINEINNKVISDNANYDEREICIGDTIRIYNKIDKIYYNTFFTGTYTNNFRDLIIFFFCLSPIDSKHHFIIRNSMIIVEPFVKVLITEKTYI
jgi:predicted RNA-binding protein